MNPLASRTVAALAASLLLVLAGCGDDENDTSAQNPTPTPLPTSEVTPSADPSASSTPSASASADSQDGQTIEINLENGKPTEKVGPTVTVATGDKLTLVITSDSAQEIHVHGLDTYIEVPAGQTVTRTLTVSLAPGSYEVEVHETEIVLFNLQVK